MSGLFDLSDDVAVVTGAGRGIGEGIAKTLATAGGQDASNLSELILQISRLV